MRRVCAVGIVVILLLFVPASRAEAQTFWRWFETLSGPTISGPAGEFIFACIGRLAPGETPSSTGRTVGDRDADPFDPNCASFDRTAPLWFSFGVQGYLLSGDNDVTPAPDGPVTARGIMPVVDLHAARLPGVSFGAAPVWRWYSTPAEDFTETAFELWVKWRPMRTASAVRRDAARAEYNFSDDGLLIRLGAIRHGVFDAGRFGAGTAALEADWSYVLSVTLDLGAWRR
jgi:hypothetical protein